jgi:hypothetical protein
MFVHRVCGEYHTLCVIAVSVWLSLVTRTYAGVNEFYVDPVVGSDAHIGSVQFPFKTLEKARDTVRAITESMSGDVTIYLRGGEYDYSDTYTTREVSLYNYPGTTDLGRRYQVKTGFQLTPADSGKNGHYVIYKSFPGEQAVITSGKKVTGWSLYDAHHNIYRAHLGPGIETRQFYLNGEPAIRARSEAMPANLRFQASYGFSTTDNAMASWNNKSDMEIAFQVHWGNHRGPISDIVEAAPVTRIVMERPFWDYVTDTGYLTVSSPAHALYIENAYELLDAEGEWYLDKVSGYLYYKPRQKDDMATCDAVIPMVDELVHIRGASMDDPAHHIVFEGIAFEYATWLRPNTDNGYHINQSNYIREEQRLPEAAFTATTTHHIRVERCQFTHLGSTAIKFITGATDSWIVGNTIYNIAGNGINFEDFNYSNNTSVALDERKLVQNVIITNNYIEKIGIDYRSAVAITMGFARDVEIRHNEILNTPFGGINIGWHTQGDQITRNIKIAGNYIYEVENNGMYDNGAIYTLGVTNGSAQTPAYIVTGNYIRNQMNNHAPLYADNGSTWWHAEGNVIDLKDSPVWHAWGSPGTPEEPQWFYTQNSNPKPKNNTFINNYVTTPFYTDYAEESVVSGNAVVPHADWPSEALAIIERAGLESEYRDIRPYPNLVQNPDFQTRQTNIWTPYDASYIQTMATSTRGTQCAKITRTATDGRIAQRVKLKADKGYGISVWVMPTSDATASVKLAVPETLTVASQRVPAGVWSKLEGAYESHMQIEGELYVELNAGDDAYHIDEFNMWEGVDVAPAPPAAHLVALSGNAGAGNTLQGHYDYYDANGDVEQGSVYEWLRGDTADAQAWTVISSGLTTSSERIPYEVVPSDVGACIKLRITPACSVAPTEGDAVASDPILILDGFRTSVQIQYVNYEGLPVQADKTVWSQLVGSTYVESIANVPERITDRDGVVWILKETRDKTILVSADSDQNVILFNYSKKR